jgi:uncharacterized membrane protein
LQPDTEPTLAKASSDASRPAVTYLLFKLLHLAAVVLFLGNITTGLFWVHRVKHRKSPAALADAMDGVIASDRLFTIPCVVLIVVGGFAAASLSGLPMLRVGWIVWGLILFSLSGLTFVWLAPLQRRIRDYARQPAADWDTCQVMLKRWDLIGAMSLIPAWIAFALMVLKVPA